MPSDRYTKKPVTVEAIQYTGANLREVLDFTGKHPRWGEWFKSFEDYEAHVCSDRGAFKVLTLEGTMEALPGDWIIRGVKGEHYPCKPDIFAATYTRADLCASGQQVRALTLSDLQAAHVARQYEWCPDQKPDLSFRGNELGGECGEAQNVIKKLERERHGWRGSRDTVEHLAEELADVIHCAILVAITAGIDIERAVIAKFNDTSDNNGLATRLAALKGEQ